LTQYSGRGADGNHNPLQSLSCAASSSTSNFAAMNTDALLQLVQKYNKPVPRYTSYPVVPVWKDDVDPGAWKQELAKRFHLQNSANGISLYLHLPFCESLCTYCGCNKKITTNHSVEEEYLKAIVKEFEMYLSVLEEPPIIRELHLGGGTPTFFSTANLELLISSILKRSKLHSQFEFSFEGHPNNTTAEHLQVLHQLGFRRVSFGVQDNDPEVQRIINRIQPLENVKRVTEQARMLGYDSVNYDLIYGLPKQSLQSITKTFHEVLDLQPDRIAFYSYAHVPWTSRGQRLFDEQDLPSPFEKIQLYLKGKELVTASGYADIGMDHFALPGDALHTAWVNGDLHRNFMGYTTQKTKILLGLGVSSISDTGTAFAQNKKSLHEYYEQVSNYELPVFRGYFLNEEDLSFRNYILDISCRGKTIFKNEDLRLLETFTFPELSSLENDGLIEWDRNGLTVTVRGRQFIRNICSAFDLYMQRSKDQNRQQLFSKAI
jgi:oxygen-independent coproporphyrinogen III oxidase